MRILSILVIASLSLMVVWATLSHASRTSRMDAMIEGADQHQHADQRLLIEHASAHRAESSAPSLIASAPALQLHPAILPILALQGRSLHPHSAAMPAAPAPPLAAEPTDLQHDAAPIGRGPAPLTHKQIGGPLTRLQKQAAGVPLSAAADHPEEHAGFTQQQPAAVAPGSQSSLQPMPVPLPLPLPLAKGRPKPCFKDC